MSLADDAYGAIFDAILKGQLEAGELLTIDALAGQLEMSRSPVQDALRQLAIQGLVVVQPRGHAVSTVTLDQLRNAFEVRLALESAATELATRRASDSELEALPAAHGFPLGRFSGYQPLPVKHEDLVPIFDAVWRHNSFHAAVAYLTRNPQLLAIVLDQLVPVTRVAVMHYASRGLRSTDRRDSSDLEQIISAMRARDEDRAVTAMRGHLVEAFNELKTFFALDLDPATAGRPLGSYADAF